MSALIDTPTDQATQTELTDVQLFLETLHAGNAFEIRSYECPTKPGGSYKRTASGYFIDTETATKYVKQVERRKPPGCYVTLNPVSPTLLARSFNEINWQSNVTTADAEIAKVRNILIDIDPDRESQISSSDDEKNRAVEIAEIIKSDLSSIGLPTPKIQGMSGNGASLILPADMAADDKHLVESLLKFLAVRFADQLGVGCSQTLDTGTFNPSRLTKVLGTFARKGTEIPEICLRDGSTPARPHRQSWYRLFDSTGVVTSEMLLDILPAESVVSVSVSTSTTTKARGPMKVVEAKPITHVGNFRSRQHQREVVLESAKGRCCEIIPALTLQPSENMDQHGNDKPCGKCGGDSRFFVLKHDGGVNAHGQVRCRKCMDRATANVIDTVRCFAAPGTYSDDREGWADAQNDVAKYLGLERYDGDDFDDDPLADMKAQQKLIDGDADDGGITAGSSKPLPKRDFDQLVHDCDLEHLIDAPVEWRFRDRGASEKWCYFDAWQPSLTKFQNEYHAKTIQPVPVLIKKKWKTFTDRMMRKAVEIKPDATTSPKCITANSISRRLDHPANREFDSFDAVDVGQVRGYGTFTVGEHSYLMMDRLYDSIHGNKEFDVTRPLMAVVLHLSKAKQVTRPLGGRKHRLWRYDEATLERLDGIAIGEIYE